MPTIDWITIKGFKSIRSIERLPLRNINILIGANGSGKSNFLGVANLAGMSKQRWLDAYVARQGGANRVVTEGTKRTNHILFEYKIGMQYQFKYNVTNEDGLSIDSEINSITELEKNVLQSHRIFLVNYHFHDTGPTSALKRIGEVHDVEILRPDGENLASVLYWLSQHRPKQFQKIVTVVKMIAPYFDEFHLRPLIENPDKIRLLWTQTNSDLLHNAAAFSDGTLRFIALATLLHLPPELRPWVIQIDEPELGLHPAAIALVAAMIKSVAAETQVIVATQSAAFVDHFEPEDILVAERIDGATEIKRLDSESLNDWLAEYSLGELWDKNIFGGRPRPEGRR
jgi:predicted ATPase